MSLSSSLFSGISGLNTLGNAMTVIGDNIANVNTVGFKSSRVTFQDVLSQTVSTVAGTAQVGRGTSLADITSSFAQGSFESTDSTTDLAVGGSGFFMVRDPGNVNNEYYTRAGEFRFDKDGNFINPAGYIVRGWALDQSGQDTGSITDVTLSSFTSPPSPTDRMTVVTNLDSGSQNSSATLYTEWDAQTTPNIPDTSYEYQTTVKVYDSLGQTHDITLYYDPGSGSTWEFIATCNPSEDNRTGAQAALAGGDDGVGMLGRGEIVFNASSGVISDINFWDFTHGTDYDLATAGNWTQRMEATDLTNGYFTLAPDFLGGSPLAVELDFGAVYSSGASSWLNDSLSTTQFASSSTTIFQSATGYGAGDLQSVTVGTDGVITGQYSNGEVIPLYRVALAKFQNIQGLYKEGGNLFRETRISGVPVTGRPGTNGLGSISPNSLEQSNVDIATEFVKMITTQRGFQANSKIITVTDQMLAELINLKR
ncbi:MAG: flagellar hook protein FlgE [Deltaproteobacteria bacterium]|nr:flagellar hook protein FlgE [Deltaproteobacteria bacterium]MBW2338810.1 flagellar hook protein FlgE [Deltaproteobacteria bacterium]